jgi:hypothetical protein
VPTMKWVSAGQTNPLVEARNRFLANRGKLASYGEALALLQEPVSGTDLSLLAGLIRYRTALEETDIRAILWVTPELDVGSMPKATRMFPIAISNTNKDLVQTLHKTLIADMHAWERTKRREGWLTLSDVMNKVARSVPPKNTTLSIQIFAVLPPGLSRKREELVHWDLYLRGSLALIHTMGEGAGDRGNFYLSHVELQRPVQVDSFCGTGSFSKFVNWLQTYTGAPRGEFIYVGFEHIQKEQIRLWAAFDPAVSAKVMAAAWQLPDMLHHSFLEYIRETVVHPVDLFLNRTEGISHDGLDQQPAVGRTELRHFIGHEEVQWPYALSDAHVREALKSLCSSVACVRGGDRPLSVLGAFLVLLSAIAHRSGAEGIAATNIQIDGGPNDFEALLPFQFRDMARDTLKHLYDLFAALVYERGSEESQSTVRSIRVEPTHLELRLSINPLASHSIQKANLATAIGNYLTTKVGYRRAHTLWGNSAVAIVEYWLRANLRTDKRDDDGRIFPPSDVFTLDYNEGDLILTFRAPQ